MKIIDQYKAFFKTPLLVKNPDDFIKNIRVFDFKPDNYSLSPQFETNQKFIGKRAELFMLEALQQSEQYEVIAHSLQIIRQKQTLGEFDFLIRDLVTAEVFQLELVYKVYLFDASLSTTADFCWIGPNRRDRFEDKLHKLKTKQFPLLYQKMATSELEGLGLKQNSIQQRLCFKAMLFKPFQEKLPVFKTLTDVQIEGEWLSKQLFYKQDWSRYHFTMPQKLNWFNAVNRVEQWFTLEQICPDIDNYLASGRSVLLFVNDHNKHFFKLFLTNW
jgi:hypothetical protein